MVRSSRRERISTVYLHPLAAGKRTTSHGTVETRYQEPTSQLDRLDESKDWSSSVEFYSNGQKVGDGVTIKTLVRTGSEQIGSCTYRVWVVEDFFHGSNGSQIGFEQYYSPELGLVIRSVQLDAEGNPVSEVRFDKIEVVGN